MPGRRSTFQTWKCNTQSIESQSADDAVAAQTIYNTVYKDKFDVGTLCVCDGKKVCFVRCNVVFASNEEQPSKHLKP